MRDSCCTIVTCWKIGVSCRCASDKRKLLGRLFRETIWKTLQVRCFSALVIHIFCLQQAFETFCSLADWGCTETQSANLNPLWSSRKWWTPSSISPRSTFGWTNPRPAQTSTRAAWRNSLEKQACWLVSPEYKRYALLIVFTFTQNLWPVWTVTHRLFTEYLKKRYEQLSSGSGQIGRSGEVPQRGVAPRQHEHRSDRLHWHSLLLHRPAWDRTEILQVITCSLMNRKFHLCTEGVTETPWIDGCWSVRDSSGPGQVSLLTYFLCDVFLQSSAADGCSQHRAVQQPGPVLFLRAAVRYDADLLRARTQPCNGRDHGRCLVQHRSCSLGEFFGTQFVSAVGADCGQFHIGHKKRTSHEYSGFFPRQFCKQNRTTTCHFQSKDTQSISLVQRV